MASAQITIPAKITEAIAEACAAKIREFSWALCGYDADDVHDLLVRLDQLGVRNADDLMALAVDRPTA